MSNDVATKTELSADNYAELTGKFDVLMPIMSVDYADTENSANAEQRDKLNADYESVSAELHDAIKNRVDTADLLTRVNEVASELAEISRIDTAELHNDAQRDFSVFCVHSVIKLQTELKALLFDASKQRADLLAELADYVTAYDTAKIACIAAITAKIKAENSEITEDALLAELNKAEIETAFDYCADATEKVETLTAELRTLAELIGLKTDTTDAKPTAKSVPVNDSEWVKPTAENNRYIASDGTAEFTCKSVLYKIAATDVDSMINAYEKSRRMKDVTAIGFGLLNPDGSDDFDENAVWNHLKVIVNHQNKHVKKSA